MLIGTQNQSKLSSVMVAFQIFSMNTTGIDASNEARHFTRNNSGQIITTHIQETQQDKQGKVASCKLHIMSEPSTRSDLANVKNKFIKAEQCSNPQEHKAQIDADK